MDIQSLKNKGIKLTKHKLAILELFKSYKHLDASQIYNMLLSNKITISLATIYRILTHFESKAVIQRHNFNHEQATYELLTPNEHHDHLICINCRNVIEFFSNGIENLQNEVAKVNNFTIASHTLNIYGICSDCQQSSVKVKQSV